VWARVAFGPEHDELSAAAADPLTAGRSFASIFRPMSNQSLPTLDFVARNYRNFNARATRDALYAYWDHVRGGGKMFWAVAGAMSSAQLGISLAPAIRKGLIHGLSVTGANLEESLFRLVAHDSYKDFPDYRYFTKRDDTKILEDRRG